MKKREFLVPVAVAASALMAATGVVAEENRSTGAIYAEEIVQGTPGGELTVHPDPFILTRAPSGSAVMAHESHVSHESHGSHGSHQSHYSGR